ncbi:MAG: molybdate transporter family protein [Dehalococcoidia bacterium]|nr:molybdate transporter family protein [Dehalococcoidia bacterium]
MKMNVLNGRIRFNRNELAGAFGDIGTSLPLIVGMVLANGLDSASVLIVFGALQIATGLLYSLPMPVQPLKAMAVIFITQKLTGDVLYGAGLAIGIIMFFLSITKLLEWIQRAVPLAVVRGIQFGLGVTLASLALKNYVQSDSIAGWALAFAGFVITILLLGNRKYPAALFLIVLGAAYAVVFKMNLPILAQSAGFALPQLHLPSTDGVLAGLVLLALPQLPLSIGNSILATKQTVADLFPEKKVTVKKIGLTYSFVNLVSSFLSGIPICHGSGGLAGHYAFGARTGGSVVIYGSIYLIIGLFFSRGFEEIVKVFPLPVLGIILLFEGLALMLLLKDIASVRKDLFISLAVALMVVGLPYGYVIGMIAGSLMAYWMSKKKISPW